MSGDLDADSVRASRILINGATQDTVKLAVIGNADFKNTNSSFASFWRTNQTGTNGLIKSRVGQIWERWRETTKIKVKKEKPVTQNILDAIEAYKTGQKVTEIFTQFGISAPTFYKFLRILGQNPARLREKDKVTLPLANN